MSFSTLGLAPELLHAVADEGYLDPTPVQREAIPLVLAGRDLLASAQTGTGKTAAFVLPILQMLTTGSPGESAHRADLPTGAARHDRSHRRPVRILVVEPTRELALQVEESVRTYGAHLPIRSTAIFGGVGFEGQARALRRSPEVVVATPGRLLDHSGQATIDLSAVDILVLDEADRLLDMGFIPDIRRIVALLPRQRQTLLFSATFSDGVRSLAAALLHDPATVEVAARNAPPDLVSQVVLRVDRDRKRALLSHLIRSGRVQQALVFTRTKHGANRLAEQLVADGIDATAIHGNKSQSRRVRSLADFKSGRVPVLVATDLAARGLDIESLPHVVNYELPMVPADYVHRIGRTGRASSPGEAISLVCVDEAKLLREIEVLLGRWIPAEVVAGFEPDRNERPQPIRLRSGGAGTQPRRVPDGDRAASRRPIPERGRERPAPQRAGGSRAPSPMHPAPVGRQTAAPRAPREAPVRHEADRPSSRQRSGPAGAHPEQGRSPGEQRRARDERHPGPGEQRRVPGASIGAGVMPQRGRRIVLPGERFAG